MALFLYLLREVQFRFQIGPSKVPLKAVMQMHLATKISSEVVYLDKQAFNAS